MADIIPHRPAFSPFSETILETGIHIALLHATRIPPHAGMIINGRYDSLTVKGRDIAVPVHAMLRNISLRRIPAIFISVANPAGMSLEELEAKFRSYVLEHEKVIAGQSSCMTPVRKFFTSDFGVSGEVNFLFELLPALDKAGFIQKNYSINIGNPGDYSLPVYGQEDIDRGIFEAEAAAKTILAGTKL